MRHLRSHAGFTLVELIVVIVLLGILASAASFFILKPIEAYVDIERRQELVDSAEMSFRRISRDINRALPNSLRLSCANSANTTVPCDNASVSRSTLEVINVAEGIRYRDQPGDTGQYNDPDYILDFISADDSFNTLGLLDESIAADYRIVIYNTTDGIYQAAENDTNNSIITSSSNSPSISTVSDPAGSDDNEHQVSLASPHLFPFQSPSQRMFFVDGTVIYLCDENNGTLTRYENDTYEGTHTDIDDSTDISFPSAGALITRNLSNCAFSYDPGTSSRAALVTMEMTLTKDGESINLLHEVHTFNVP